MRTSRRASCGSAPRGAGSSPRSRRDGRRRRQAEASRELCDVRPRGSSTSARGFPRVSRSAARGPGRPVVPAGRTRAGRERRDDRAARHGVRAACERLADLARGEHDRDPLDASRRAANPSAWADARSSQWASSTTHSRALPGGLRQQAEHREANEERFGAGPRTQPERDVERVALRTRQALTEVKDRRAELLNRGERELHLALDPGRSADTQPAADSTVPRAAPSCRRRARRERPGRRRGRRARPPPTDRGPLARVPGPAAALAVTSFPIDADFLVALSMPLGSRTTEFRDARPAVRRDDRVDIPRTKGGTPMTESLTTEPARGRCARSTSPRSSPAATRNEPATISQPTSRGTAAPSGP